MHELLKVWFHCVETWGYAGIFVLMAMESSVVPIPSEVILPPAAFWAAQGRMNFALVVIVAAAGGYCGSVVNYWVFKWIGPQATRKYGKYVLVTPRKFDAAEKWARDYGAPGVFLARLLPVIRHLISIPAGILEMPLIPFSIATIAGAGLWDFVLAWFGREVLGARPDLLDSPEAMVAAVKAKIALFVIGAVFFAVLYVGYLVIKKRGQSKTAVA